MAKWLCFNNICLLHVELDGRFSIIYHLMNATMIIQFVWLAHGTPIPMWHEMIAVSLLFTFVCFDVWLTLHEHPKYSKKVFRYWLKMTCILRTLFSFDFYALKDK